MGTHIEVTRRAEHYFKPTGEHLQEYMEVVNDHNHKAYLEAGSFFPDWGYACAGQNDASEAAHWPPFWNATILHLQENYSERPWGSKARGLVSFLLGVVSHGASDSPWHSLDMGNGFIEALQFLQFRGNYGEAHSAADIGGEFVLAHSSDLGYFSKTWKVPTGDLIEIYRRINISVTALEINECMLQGYVATTGVRLIGRLLYPRWAEQSPFLVDYYYDYFRGGINDMATWVTTCWHDTLEWIIHGPQISPMCKSMDRDYVKRKRPIHEIDDVPDVPDPDDNTEDSSSKCGSKQFDMLTSKLVVAQSLFAETGAKSVMDYFDNIATIDMRFSWTGYLRKVQRYWLYLTTKGDQNDLRPSGVSKESEPRHGLKKIYHRVSLLGRTVWNFAGEMFFEMAERLEVILNPWTYNSCNTVEDTNHMYIKGDAEFSSFGESLVSGDFDGDGVEDLVIGAPGYTPPNSSAPQIGAVYVVSGSLIKPSQRSLTLSFVVNQQFVTTIMGDPNEAASRFGSSMAVADLNGDGIDDLIVSAPWYNAQELFYDGRVYIFFGRRGLGLRSVDNSTSHLSSFNATEAGMVIAATQKRPDHVPGAPYNFLFTGLGSRLMVADLDCDGALDLVLGSPDADIDNLSRRGLIHGFMGQDIRKIMRESYQLGAKQVVVNVTDSASWIIDSGDLQPHEVFGSSLAFAPEEDNPNGRGILLVGAPGWKDYENNGRAIGRLYGYRFGRNDVRPELSFTITGISELDAFSSKSLRMGKLQGFVAVSSPYERSVNARSKFLDFPGLLTSERSQGKVVGAVRILDPFAVPGGDIRLNDTHSFVHATITGSGSNARFGVSLATGRSDKAALVVSEPMVDGERGRVYLLPKGDIVSEDSSSIGIGKFWTMRRRTGAQCIRGASLYNRLGSTVLVADLHSDIENNDELILSSGTHLKDGKVIVIF